MPLFPYSTLVANLHRLLLIAWPVTPYSPQYLTDFVNGVDWKSVPQSLLHFILLRGLMSLDQRDLFRFPLLADRYRAAFTTHWPNAGVDKRVARLRSFESCVREEFRYHSVACEPVRHAIAVTPDVMSRGALSSWSLAKRVSCHPRTLSELFREHTGATLNCYTHRTRVGYGARLLIETSTPIRCIATMLGYRHVSDFDHALAHTFRTSPLKYRRRFARLFQTRSPSRRRNGEAVHRPPPLRILIVDSDLATRKALCDQLTFKGHSVLGVASIASYQSLGQGLNPDAIILDCPMDVTANVSTLAMARSSDLSNARLVVLVTSNWSLELSARASPLPLEVVPKPCSVTMIERLLPTRV